MNDNNPSTNENGEWLQRFLPGSRPGRIVLGVALIFGGVLGFLPVLGFWMIPLGLVVLSHDIPAARRFRRRWAVRIGRWKASRQPSKAE